MNNESEKLISIDEVVKRAKEKGVDFGKGDPKNRLRYYTKIGLIPHAKRKSFNGSPPVGAYPESVVETLIEIDREIKEGKSVQQIKREIEKGKKKIFSEKVDLIPQIPIEKSFFRRIEEGGEEIKAEGTGENLLEKRGSEVSSKKNLLKIFAVSLLIWVLGFAITDSFLNNQLSGKITSLFMAKVNLSNITMGKGIKGISEGEGIKGISEGESREEENNISPQYLSINAETSVNGPLEVEGEITAPKVSLKKGEFLGTISLSNLTSNRSYIFPDQSGTVCLSTGNCVGAGGEVIGTGGTISRVARFVGSQRIENSSIADLFNNGVSLTIDRFGNIGVGTNNPSAKLDVSGSVFVKDKLGIGVKNPKNNLEVKGKIHATGDICTDLNGGKCLSQMFNFPPVAFGGGISGAGTSSIIPLWTNNTTLGNSIISQNGNVIDIAGTIKTTGFQLTTGAHSGYVLVSDDQGIGTWQEVPGGLPSGTEGQTLRYDETQGEWVANSFLFNSGSQIGIGIDTNLPAVLSIAGDGTIPELGLKYDDNNYLNFLTNDTESKIEASKAIVINSLTGEVKMGGDVTTFDASESTIKGLTFISSDTDSTVRKSGEEVLRGVEIIFPSPLPAQTSSTSYVRVSKYFQNSSDNPLYDNPSLLPGADKKFRLIINFADDIPIDQTSDWRIYRPGSLTEYAAFQFSGQNLSSLEEGVSHMTDLVDIPESDWQLEVKVPAGYHIRIFNILLVRIDQIK